MGLLNLLGAAAKGLFLKRVNSEQLANAFLACAADQLHMNYWEPGVHDRIHIKTLLLLDAAKMGMTMAQVDKVQFAAQVITVVAEKDKEFHQLIKDIHPIYKKAAEGIHVATPYELSLREHILDKLTNYGVSFS